MPTFIPARGRTLHPVGVCVNRIGTVHSKAPRNTNANAQEACAALWAAASGPVKRGRKIAGKWRIPSDGTSTEVWRDHLREAKLRAESEEAKLLKRSLILGWAETPASPEEVELIRRLGG